MKHLQKFPLINESRSQVIDESKFKEILKTKCSNWSLDNEQIYRGVQYNKENFLYINPKEYERPSKGQDGINIYSIIIENNKDWSYLPKRTKSIICSNSIVIASEYSEEVKNGESIAHIVIPFNDTKWCISPSNDIWHSFKNLGLENLEIFNSVMSGVIFKLSKVSTSEMVVGINTYNDVKYFLSKINFDDKEYINKIVNEIIDELSSYETAVKFDDSITYHLLNNFKEVKNAKEMLHIIINSLPPDDFDLQSYDRQGIRFNGDEKECWSDGEALLIRKDVFDKMFNL